MTQRLTRFTFADGLLVLLLLALPAWALVRSRAAGPAAEVRVVHDGRLVAAYPLDQDRSFYVSCRRPDDVRIEIKAGRVRVAESDCPRGLCLRQGWISTPGRSIVCVPNRLVVEVRGKAQGYDVEAY